MVNDRGAGQSHNAAGLIRRMVEKYSMKLPRKPEPAQTAIGIALLALVGVLGWWMAGGMASSQTNPPRQRTVAVAVAKAVIKDLPYRVEAPGAVQPVVSVSIRARVDSQVEKVMFED